MHRPSISDILKNNESYYSLVIAVSKRAREIVEDAEKHEIEVVEKPVKIAVEEFANGDYTLIEEEGIGDDIR